MSNYKKHWNPTDKVNCIQDYENGMSLQDLANKYQRSVGGIFVVINNKNQAVNSDHHRISKLKDIRAVKEKKEEKKKEREEKKKEKEEKKKEKKQKKPKTQAEKKMEQIDMDIENMKRDYNNGMKVKDISNKYKYKEWYIVAALYPKQLPENNIRYNNGRKWTEEDHEYLLDNCYDKSVEELAENLCRSEKSIVCRLIRECIYDINE